MLNKVILVANRFLKDDEQVEIVIKEREKAMAKQKVPTLKEIRSWERKVKFEFGKEVDLNDLDEHWEEVYGEDSESITLKIIFYPLQ